MSQREIVNAYRHLYRTLLRAVQYAMPARIMARDQLRAAFREPGARWDAQGVKRTLWFLQAAAREKGLEHKVVRNLLRVRWEKLNDARRWKKNLASANRPRTPLDSHKDTATHHYDMTIAMLNKSMGLCLR